MAQGVFGVLVGRVAGLGEGAEGGDIGEVAIAEAAHIQIPRRALDDVPRGLQDVLGQAEARGKVVGAAGGDIADGHGTAAVQHPGDDFVERAVAADADVALDPA